MTFAFLICIIKNMKNTNLIIDFDSTIIKTEGLEELASISLQNKTNKEEIIQKIEKITNLGMEGSIGFTESLSTASVIGVTRNINPSYLR